MLDCQLDHNGQPDPKKQIKMPRIIGIREHMEIQRVKQMEKTGPDGWVQRKCEPKSLSDFPEVMLTACLGSRGWGGRLRFRLFVLCLRGAIMCAYDQDGR